MSAEPDSVGILRQQNEPKGLPDDASQTPSVSEGASEQTEAVAWRPIETAPETKGGYLFCLLAWGPEADRTTAFGFRHGGRWFAAPAFYKSAPFDQCQYELRQIEVLPSFWAEMPPVHPLYAHPQTSPDQSVDWGVVDRLEELARAATPGPWVFRTLENFGGNVVRYRNGDKFDIEKIAKAPSEPNAAFIAAANPSVVLNLIAALRTVQQ